MIENVLILKNLGFLILGIALGYWLRLLVAKRKRDNLEEKIKKIVSEAKQEAKNILLEAKEKATKIIEKAQEEEKERKKQLLKIEERLVKREEIQEKRAIEIEKQKRITERKEKEIQKTKEEIEKIKARIVEKLEEIAKMDREKAKEELMKIVEKNAKEDLLESLKKLEKHRREELEKKAAEIVSEAIQRYTRSHIGEVTTSIVPLPSDEIKGKIIGKEGRNIRTFEKATGVEVIIDETPEVVILSSFSPLRREIAKLALEKLIKDGRIQPARIEEKVEEAKSEISEKIKELGEEAAYELGIYDLPKEIIFLLGRLAYRTSFGQNVLLHSVEAAHLAEMMAAELGLNVEVAKKAALLHDIGKAIDYEIGGDHVEIGKKILEKYKIEKEVIEAMQSHHENYPFASPESYIVAAADAASAARPGARKESLEKYLKRLEDLENIATSFEGVEKAYAIQAGREIRVFVDAKEIDDLQAMKLAREIAKKIEKELKYPGEIKVNVIRELRATEYAR